MQHSAKKKHHRKGVIQFGTHMYDQEEFYGAHTDKV